VQIYEPEPGDDPVPPEEPGEGGDGTTIGDPEPPEPGPEPEPGRRVKYYVNDVPVFVVNERVQYYGPDGKLITESLTRTTPARASSES
jgi:type I restriction enzyme R subunit